MQEKLNHITAKDFMSASLVTFTPATSILDAIRELLDKGISGAPVIDRYGGLIGMLSEKDCLKVALNASYFGEAGGKVEDFMTREPITVEADASIIEVAQMFLKSPFKRYPVVTDNRIVGQISRSDVLRAIDKLA